MSTALQENENETKKHKKHRSPWLILLLIIFLILFLLTTIVLGSRLYDMATRDQYTVDLGMGNPEGEIELFRVEYENELGEITVQGSNGVDVVAPGTSIEYDLRLRNEDDVIIDFLMCPSVEFLTADPVPVEFKIVDAHGNYIIGSDTQWGNADAMNALQHKGSVHPGEVYTYHVSWQWVFEAGDEQDAYDTYLGNQDGEILPGIKVGLTTESSANPTPPKSNAHMMHLLGEGFGCCWCCYLVWLLVLICLLLLIWIWRLNRKLNKLEEQLEEYEETLAEEVGAAAAAVAEQSHEE